MWPFFFPVHICIDPPSPSQPPFFFFFDQTRFSEPGVVFRALGEGGKKQCQRDNAEMACRAGVGG